MTEFKGSILELNNKQAIVMTDKCEFISIKRLPEMFVGQQLTFKKSDIKRQTKSYIRYVALIASVFVLAFFSLLYLQLYNPNAVFAYIDVDINPSLEFTIDNNSEVISIKALNPDAETLLKNLQLKKIPVREAISKVMEASREQGFISNEKSNEVLVSATLELNRSSKTNTENEKALDSILSDIKEITIQVGTENVKPEVLKVPNENRKSAVDNNISMGRYELYKKIKQKNPDITIEKAKSERVSEMLDKAEVKKSNETDKKTTHPSKSMKEKKNKHSDDRDESNNNPGDKENFKSDKQEKFDKYKNSDNRDKDRDRVNSKSNSNKKNNDSKSNDRNNKSNKDKDKSQSKSDWPNDYSDKNSVKDNSGASSEKNNGKINENSGERNNSKNNSSDKTNDNTSGKKHDKNDKNDKNENNSHNNSSGGKNKK